MLQKLLRQIAPHSCLRCGREDSLLCKDCIGLIEPPQHVTCINCGAKDDLLCGRCANESSLHGFKAYAEYGGLVSELVRATKFSQRREGAEIMGGLLADAVAYDVDIVSYIPTHAGRLRTRGFDHAELMARNYARKRALPFRKLLGRQSEFRQVGADRTRRIRQAQQGFYLPAHRFVTGKRVVLVDDVVSTGATLFAAASCLKMAGADEVYAVVFGVNL